jgi:hypothetical protein
MPTCARRDVRLRERAGHLREVLHGLEEACEVRRGTVSDPTVIAPAARSVRATAIAVHSDDDMMNGDHRLDASRVKRRRRGWRRRAALATRPAPERRLPVRTDCGPDSTTATTSLDVDAPHVSPSSLNV